LKRIVYILLVIVFFCTNANGQEIVLSQQYLSSQFLSPAAVGGGDAQQRIQTNYRSQMFDGNNQNRTIVIGWDTRLKRKDPDLKNYLGIGAQIMSDQLMDGLLQTNHLTINMAYHLFLDDDDHTNLSMGLGGTFSQTSVDKSKLRFGDQYDEVSGEFKGYNTSFENLKPFPYRVSANAGMLYTRHFTESFFQVSLNAFYYGMPEVTYSNLNEASKMRATFFANFEHSFNGYATYLLHASYNNRLNNGDITRQVMVGGAVGLPILYQPDQIKRIYFGCFYRLSDAVVPTISLMMDNYHFGISYDFYNNAISGASLRQNGFEISLSKSFGARRNDFLKTLFD